MATRVVLSSGQTVLVSEATEDVVRALQKRAVDSPELVRLTGVADADADADAGQAIYLRPSGVAYVTAA